MLWLLRWFVADRWGFKPGSHLCQFPSQVNKLQLCVSEAQPSNTRALNGKYRPNYPHITEFQVLVSAAELQIAVTPVHITAREEEAEIVFPLLAKWRTHERLCTWSTQYRVFADQVFRLVSHFQYRVTNSHRTSAPCCQTEYVAFSRIIWTEMLTACLPQYSIQKEIKWHNLTTVNKLDNLFWNLNWSDLHFCLCSLHQLK